MESDVVLFLLIEGFDVGILSDVKQGMIYNELKLYNKMPVPRVDYARLLQTVPADMHPGYKQFKLS
jgi:hypothetical protein